MWCLGTWFSEELGSAGLTAGLDLTGLSQLNAFHDSIIIRLPTFKYLSLQVGQSILPKYVVC